MRIASAVLLATFFITGCSSIWEMKYGSDKPQITYVRQSDGQNTGDLYVWHPYSNAAYMSHDGATCIKTADAARIQASATAAGLAADALGSKVTGLEANYSSQLSQAAMLLANQDAKGTFLSVALFNLCMMSLDKKIVSEAHIVDLFKESLKRASEMTTPTFNPQGNITIAPVVGPPTPGGGNSAAPAVNVVIDQASKTPSGGAQPGAQVKTPAAGQNKKPDSKVP